MVNIDQARFLAYDAGIDLVEINPNANPPVVRMLDFGKYRYEQEKKKRESKAKAKAGELKEIRLSRKIDKHDLETKAKRARGWLEDGDKVRVYLQLMGREMIFAEQSKEIIHQLRDTIGGVYESEPKQMGNRIIAIIKGK